ncbi:MAG: sulfatase-like hydrolase/transferase [Planctomycetes bacterium]|nr:sulfatase-like hydrolase/transferase [Planctomycetota bacterium]
MNFIYYNVDEMRSDVLGCYGHPLVKTPNIDRFAATGVRFDQCHVQHTVCSPSRCSYMTGWYPHTHGHRSLWHLLKPDEPNTLKYLKAAGYEVHWIGKNDLLAAESFGDSVTQIHAVEGGGKTRRSVEAGRPGYMDFLYEPMAQHHQDFHRAGKAVEFLKSRKGGDPPFMLFMALGLPHCPYTAPQPWYDMYVPHDIPPLLPAELAGKPAFHQWIRKYRRLDEIDESRLRKIMAVYLGMVSYVDHMFGRLLGALDETGLSDDTAVFFFSDHGDWAGDYGLVEKWPSALDDRLTHIPMIVRTPGCAAGHVVAEPVECFDIMPTTLALADVEVRHAHHARSMVPQLQGLRGDADRAVFAEGGYDPQEEPCFEGSVHDSLLEDPGGIYYPKALQQREHSETVCRAAMIRTLTHKLIRRPSGVNELYDLSADSGELRNVYGQAQYADVQADLLSRMLDWYIRTSDVVAQKKDSRHPPKAGKFRHGL